MKRKWKAASEGIINPLVSLDKKNRTPSVHLEISAPGLDIFKKQLYFVIIPLKIAPQSIPEPHYVSSKRHLAWKKKVVCFYHPSGPWPIINI